MRLVALGGSSPQGAPGRLSFRPVAAKTKAQGVTPLGLPLIPTSSVVAKSVQFFTAAPGPSRGGDFSLLWVFHHAFRAGCVKFLLGDGSIIVSIDLRKVHDVRSGVCLG